MRKLLTIASIAVIAIAMPAAAKPGNGGGGKGGGPKAEHGHRGGGGPAAGHGGGPGGGHGGGHSAGGKADRGPKAGPGGWAGREMRAPRSDQRQSRPERRWAKAEQKREKQWRKAEAKSARQWAKQERGTREDRQIFRAAEHRQRLDDRSLWRDDRRFAAGFAGSCPPGLAKKSNGCLPPGQANKQFRLGERIPLAYYPSYNLPAEYRDWYYDTPEYSYRYDDGNIYRVDNQTSLISALIPLLGGGFGVGSLLPAGYDTYNLPMQYRDDYQDSEDAYYRYGDDAIYQVDPQTQMIQSVVALLSGDLNVGQMLPTGYDTYNLPMDYRDQYQDSDDAWYRYADGNIYEVDPQSRMIEAIVQQLA